MFTLALHLCYRNGFERSSPFWEATCRPPDFWTCLFRSITGLRLCAPNIDFAYEVLSSFSRFLKKKRFLIFSPFCSDGALFCPRQSSIKGRQVGLCFQPSEPTRYLLGAWTLHVSIVTAALPWRVLSTFPSGCTAMSWGGYWEKLSWAKKQEPYRFL